MKFSKSTQKMLYRFILLGMLLCAAGVTFYYWNTQRLEAIQKLPVSVLILVLVYIVLNYFKKQFSAENHWWDWVYYLGLVAILIPIIKPDEKFEVTYNYVTDFGCLFLIFPVLMAGKSMLDLNTKNSNDTE